MKPLVINQVNPLPIEYLSPNLEYSGGEIIKEPVVNEELLIARRAAEAHRRSRYKIQSEIKPGMTLNEICTIIESSTRILLKGEKNDGIGFPTGVSINECAAHFTTIPGAEEIYLKESDVLKIDFGTHVDGRIMDSAFTICFDPQFENLLLASKESMEEGIKAAGVDVRVCDIGERIGEVISSYELTLNGKNEKIIPVSNLNGHSIGKYEIHSGISIPITKNEDQTRLKEDRFYAIETFATTGRGLAKDGDFFTHYILDQNVSKHLINEDTKRVYKCISEKIGTLPFCQRYVDYILQENNYSNESIEYLTKNNILIPFEPHYENEGAYVAQFEHTIYLSSNGGKEIVSRGEDY
ncbi:methionine aminopeptidase, type II [Anncaliia algerae PRA339]|uniref:Methionine aminopeptidase, type II n=2 Tax=Anncaliia algerae PRA339 TaxID=1288291 RepID=A0A059F2X3_9MICR|nr:methionine aminopeptidase, type II [Anncaliia algerae PRA339]